MNEFIIWDEELKKFITFEELKKTNPKMTYAVIFGKIAKTAIHQQISSLPPENPQIFQNSNSIENPSNVNVNFNFNSLSDISPVV